MIWRALLIIILLTPGPAFAQNAQSLAGRWLIVVTDEENPSFSGSADIRYDIENDVLRTTLITEDSCCGGNYSKVKQKSAIKVIGNQIQVRSKIETFLEQEIAVPSVTYSADDFDLTWVDNGTLIGTLNGYTAVKWVRDAENIS